MGFLLKLGFISAIPRNVECVNGVLLYLSTADSHALKIEKGLIGFSLRANTDLAITLSVGNLKHVHLTRILGYSIELKLPATLQGKLPAARLFIVCMLLTKFHQFHLPFYNL